MSGRFTTSDGVSLAYEVRGQGLPLLCLPGLTRNARDFDDLGAVLPDGIRMIVLTSRGRGASDWAEDKTTYAVPVEARDALELLDHLGVARATVLGTSRGGLIAMLLAAVAKPRLAAVLLNDIGPELMPEGLEKIMGYIGVPPKGRTYADVAVALKATMATGFPDLSDARWLEIAERWFDVTDSGVALRYDPALRDALIAQSAAPAPDLWPLFDALEGLPLAVIRGANSDLLSAETVAAMAARRPDMIVAEVPNRGHVPFLDEPEALAALTAIMGQIEDDA